MACFDAVSGLAKAGDGSAMQWLPGRVPMSFAVLALSDWLAGDGVHSGTTEYDGNGIGPTPPSSPGSPPPDNAGLSRPFQWRFRGLGGPNVVWGSCSESCRPGHLKSWRRLDISRHTAALALSHSLWAAGVTWHTPSNLARPVCFDQVKSVLSYCVLLHLGFCRTEADRESVCMMGLIGPTGV